MLVHQIVDDIYLCMCSTFHVKEFRTVECFTGRERRVIIGIQENASFTADNFSLLTALKIVIENHVPLFDMNDGYNLEGGNGKVNSQAFPLKAAGLAHQQITHLYLVGIGSNFRGDFNQAMTGFFLQDFIVSNLQLQWVRPRRYLFGKQERLATNGSIATSSPPNLKIHLW